MALTAAEYQGIARAITGHGTVYYARKDGNDANDGLSPGTAKLTLSAALALATDGDKVLAGPGTWQGPFTLPAGVTLGGCGRRTVLTGDGSGTSFTVTAGNNAVIEDVEFSGSGYAIGSGAAGATGVLVRRCHASGVTDFLYSLYHLEAVAEDCVAEDCNAMFDLGLAEDSVIRAYRCRAFRVNYFLAYGGGTFVGIDCYAHCPFDNGEFALFESTGGADVTLLGGAFSTASAQLFHNYDDAGGVFRVCGTAFDPDKTVGTILTFDGYTEAIKAKTDTIGSGTVTAVSPVDAAANVTVRRARDYAAADGLALDWTNADGTWPDLTGATVKLLVGKAGRQTALYAFDGSVVTPTGDDQQVRVALTAAQLAVTPDAYTYEVVATLASGRKVTLEGCTGSMSVLLGMEEPS